MATKKAEKDSFTFEYDRKKRLVTITWTCPLKKEKVKVHRKGSQYRTKSLKVELQQGEVFKTAKARIENELRAIANKEIQQADIELQQWQLQNKSKTQSEEIHAAKYLRNMKPEHVCGTANEKTRYYAKQYVTAFGNWIAETLGEDFELLKIKKEHCEDWLRYLETEKHYSFSTIGTMKRMVQYAFDRIEETFAALLLTYSNPFKKIKMKKCGLKKTRTNRKENYTHEQLAYILKRAGESPYHTANMKKHTFAFFYFLMVTGWRAGDIAGLKWEEIDLEKKVITKLFKKTENSSGMICKLFITPLMEWILEMMKELPAPKRWKQYVFCNGRDETGDLIGSNVTKAQNHIANMRKELGLTKTNDANKSGGIYAMNSYAVHSIRGTVTSLLKGAGKFNNDLVEYILGHTGDSVSQQNYERFDTNPELYTREAIEFMEIMIEAEQSFAFMILPPKMAQSRVDYQMPSGWQKKLLVGFWQEDAVKIVEKWFNSQIEAGSMTAAKQLRDLIKRADEWRITTGSPKITPSLVRHILKISTPPKQ